MIKNLLKTKYLTVIIILIFITNIFPTFENIEGRNSDFVLEKQTSDKGTWELLSDGFGNPTNFATRGICIFENELYFGTDNFNLSRRVNIKDILDYIVTGFKRGNFKPWPQFIYSLKSDGCEVWKYNDTTGQFTQLVGNLPEAGIEAGFGTQVNSLASFLIEFKGELYVGTDSNVLIGCEIWRYDGNDWDMVVSGGFDDLRNDGAHSAIVFKDHLYVGTMNWDSSKTGFCQVWRTSDGENWTKVVDRGFRDFDTTEKTNNRYAWNFGIYKDEIYIGTYNNPTLFGHKGGQLWKSSDGVSWTKVELTGGDGFGEPMNYGMRNIEEYNGWLYVGAATMGLNGLEIWRYDENTWVPEIGDDVPGVKFKPKNIRNDGFGDRNNDYPFSMIVTSDNELWVGTSNSKGCEMFKCDGSNWTQIVGDNENSEIENGFGYAFNVGIRSMLEYPEGSGNIIIGTSTTFSNPKTCQIWKRNVV